MDEMNVPINMKREKADLEKFANYYFLMHYWMENMEKNKTLENFFIKRGYTKIAIYGTGFLGKHLEVQLPERLKPVFTVDQEIVCYKGKHYPLSESDDIFTKADVIIITPIADYELIKMKINLDLIDVVSLEEVILSL